MGIYFLLHSSSVIFLSLFRWTLAEQTSRIWCFDHGLLCIIPSVLAADGVHLLQMGNRIFAQEWADLIKKTFKLPSKWESSKARISRYKPKLEDSVIGRNFGVPSQWLGDGLQGCHEDKRATDMQETMEITYNPTGSRLSSSKKGMGSVIQQKYIYSNAHSSEQEI